MKNKYILAIIGIFVGALIAIQFRSYAEVTNLLNRDLSTADAFAQIYALKTANESLEEDISALEVQLAQYQDQASGYDALVAEIEKSEILIGNKPIFGGGVSLSVDAELTVEWMIDIVNEMWGAGAEAVSVNGLRFTDTRGGFYKINDLLLLDGKILETPYTIDAIGDVEVIENVLSQPGGILSRLEDTYTKNTVSLERSSRLVMGSVTIE